jgi:acyl-coenzyme A synthetase/AMP-(fatty) acid ligase
MNDSVEFVAPGRFTLLGRADRNVKILEKYVSLPEVEAALEKHAFVAKAHALASREAVPRIWALVEPTAEGKAALKRHGYGGTTALLKRETPGLPSFAFPRRIRYVGAFPYNEQGKLVNAEVYPRLRSRYQEPV